MDDTHSTALGESPPGTRFGPYEIVEKLGAGGMGDVYKARDVRLDRTVAIKVLSVRALRDGALRERLYREARAISRLNHPHICTLYDIGEQNGVDFLVMEYIEGETLAARLARGAIALPEALQHALEIARALVAAHQQNIIHRDLKPSNVMVTATGAKLLDFGIAKLCNVAVSSDAPTAPAVALTSEGVIVGTPEYCAPEQIEGRPVDGRTDIFAFGLVLYEMVTGRKAFDAASHAGVMAAILDREPPSLRALEPAAPPWLEAFVGRCLAKAPADRWSSSMELLARLAEGMGVGAAQARDARRVGPAVWIGTGVAALAALVALVGVRQWRTPVLTERDTILLTDFANTTGEPIFDVTLKHALALHLEQSPFLGIVPDQQVRETLQFMNRSPDEPVVNDVAREICQRRGIKALLTGAIQRLGGSYVVDLTAADCLTGETLVRDQATATTREGVLPAIGEAGSRMRRKLGESLASIERYDVPIQQVTTASLDAFKVFALGEQQRMKGGDRDAVPFYKRAIELDSDFALAYQRVALMYRNLGDLRLDAAYAREAFERRGKVSERERLTIEARYYFAVTGELHKVLETHRVLATTYTRDWSAAGNVAVNLAQLGRHEEALEAGLEALRRAPDNPLIQTNAASQYLRLNRFDEAEKHLGEVVRRGQRVAGARDVLYRLAFLRGDRAAMEQHRQASRAGVSSLTLARIAASEGRWREAQGLYSQAISASTTDSIERASQIAAERAVFAALFGRLPEAVHEGRSAAAMSTNPHAIWSAAVAIALAGAAHEAQPSLTRLVGEYPLHTLIQNVGLPSARAAQELGRARPSAALTELARAEAYESGSWPWVGPACLTIYLKGQAHLALGNAEDAAAEFQKIIDRKGLAAGTPLWALAHLGLGRAHAAAGAVEPARQAYDAFLGMWQHGDEDLPILREARSERARLGTHYD